MTYHPPKIWSTRLLELSVATDAKEEFVVWMNSGIPGYAAPSIEIGRGDVERVGIQIEDTIAVLQQILVDIRRVHNTRRHK